MNLSEKRQIAEANVGKCLQCFATDNIMECYWGQPGIIKKIIWQHDDVGFYLVQFGFGEGVFGVGIKNIYQIMS